MGLMSREAKKEREGREEDDLTGTRRRLGEQEWLMNLGKDEEREEGEVEG